MNQVYKGIFATIQS